MKSIIFSLLFLLFTTVSFAQKNYDDVVYLDSLHQMSDELHYKYIRITKDFNLKKDLYSFSEYYKSGKMASTGTTKDKFNAKPFGDFLTFYENGNKKLASNYDDFGISGKQYGWYENGNIKFENEFTFDKKTKEITKRILNYLDENNVKKVVDGNGFFEDNGEGEFSKGAVKNGFKEGVWEGSFNKLKCRYKETYKEGTLISGESFDEKNISYQYTEDEIRPESKNGMASFYKYVAKNFKLSQEAIRNNVSGKIYIGFVVDVDGKIVEPKVIKDLGFGTGEEAIRVLINSEDWIPGKLKGQNVRCSFSLPISIKTETREQEPHFKSPYRTRRGL